MQDVAARAAHTFQRTPNAALATVSGDGQPWNSAVFVSFDEDLSIYWSSHNDAVHSRNIAANPHVFLVVFDSHTPDQSGHAVYIRAVARQLEDEASIARGLNALAKRRNESVKSPADFIGRHPRRVYQAHPEAVWTNVLMTRDGHYFDERVSIDLRSALANHQGAHPQHG